MLYFKNKNKSLRYFTNKTGIRLCSPKSNYWHHNYYRYFMNKIIRTLLVFAVTTVSLFLTHKALALSCSASADTWGSGYVINVTVVNDGSSAIDSWQVELAFDQNPGVTGSWSANIEESGSTVIASNVSWNGFLESGQSTSFGFQGTHNGNFSLPSCSASSVGIPTPTPSPSPSPGPTVTPTPTSTPSITPTPTVTPTPVSGELVIEENTPGFCGVDGTIDTNNGGFTGSGFANTSNIAGATITWQVQAEFAGNYQLDWRYASASTNGRSAAVSVNGSNLGTVNFPTTGAWDSWTIDSAQLYLAQGNNTITLIAQTNEGLPNVDSLTLLGNGVNAVDCQTPTPSPSPSPTPSPTPTPPPADVTVFIQENANGFCSVDGSIDNENSGYTGSGYANTDNMTGQAINWSVDTSAANYVLEWRYANGSTIDRAGTLKVNGNTVRTVSFPTTGDWASWADTRVSVALEEGVNSIRLESSTTEGLANIDSLALTGISVAPASCPLPQDCNNITSGTILTVAANGSAQYSSVQSAVNSVSSSNNQQVVIRIRPGTYYEKLLINRPNITFCGETGAESSTILTYSDGADTAGGTSASYSVSITANDISMENLTIQNTRGVGSQGVALRVSAERAQFKNMRFLGYQDTLYTHGGTQYFRDCYVEGSVDYIFGAATAVFENCHVHSLVNGTAVVAPNTAIERSYGLVFLGGQLTKASAVRDGAVALGRNWGAYGAATFIGVYLDTHIAPEGWRPMGSNTLDTSRFSEYQNTGPGSATSQRAPQSNQLSASQASQYTVDNILSPWIPSFSQ
ncbi:pectinesterase [Teredinibacter turnerae T7901]|uniref:Pectinesterase n=1 Tax=Teredinibacter turnerae (strain ATCC 39867 / T7901) TaxID=377629 RepID=C5BK67_TERTT|nr:pectinesterase [Teredinibacter turnerae T7901]